jgi:hypothetical protein
VKFTSALVILVAVVFSGVGFAKALVCENPIAEFTSDYYDLKTYRGEAQAADAVSACTEAKRLARTQSTECASFEAPCEAAGTFLWDVVYGPAEECQCSQAADGAYTCWVTASDVSCDCCGDVGRQIFLRKTYRCP